VRFSIVLLGLAAIVVNNEEIRRNYWKFSLYIAAFFIITIVGNMIARTTTVGAGMALAYYFFAAWKINPNIKASKVGMFGKLTITLGIFIAIATVLYNTNDYVHHLLRFAFEGFFNWYETGVWTTGSTEKLDSTMWLWPETTRAWIIGVGVYAPVLTDIGYCIFVWYSGLIGLTVFSLFFVYNAYACSRKFKHYNWFFLFLLAMSFVIWIKVATDLFIIYALLYCIDSDEEPEEETVEDLDEEAETELIPTAL
jgi:hypothetical protein